MISVFSVCSSVMVTVPSKLQWKVISKTKDLWYKNRGWANHPEFPLPETREQILILEFQFLVFYLFKQYCIHVMSMSSWQLVNTIKASVHLKLKKNTLSGCTGHSLVWHSKVARSRLTQCKSCDLHRSPHCSVQYV